MVLQTKNPGGKVPKRFKHSASFCWADQGVLITKLITYESTFV